MSQDHIARLMGRLRSDRLRVLLQLWSDTRGMGGLPAPETIPPLVPELADNLALAEVDRRCTPPIFTVLRSGKALDAAACRPLAGTSIGESGTAAPEDLIGSAVWAYRRCAAAGQPTYEYGDFDFGDGRPVLFERLLLPLGTGFNVTHVLTVALFTAPTEETA